ncbi:MAG: hypothetical protein HN618_03120, partial [Flavobacteriales bacterium]|nr:hypothetical protein [Flavobacteriales bacterium]
MADSIPINIKLHESAPKGLSIVPESEWTDYDKAIWDQFDEFTDGLWMGEPPSHGKMAIGRMAEKPVLITRTEYADGLDGMGLWESDKFSHTLVVDGNVFLYPESPPKDNVVIFDEWIEIYSTILEEDGEYDLFKEKIPDDFFWCVEEMYPECTEGLVRYINDEAGSFEGIVDPKVRGYLQVLCDDASKACPYCKTSVGEVCEHLLAHIDLTFRDIQMGAAEDVFYKAVEASNEEDAGSELYDMFVEACREVAEVYEAGGEEDGAPGYSSVTETYWSDDMKTAL